VLLHLWQYGMVGWDTTRSTNSRFLSPEMLLMGIIANYAAVTADTLSSELGILSKSKPILITTFRAVPPGTNGGVTIAGLQAGVGGAVVIAATSLLLLHFQHGASNPFRTFIVLSSLGTAGTLLDSLLGAVLQASVIDRRSGKIVEGAGGVKVLTRSQHPVSHVRNKSEESRLVNSGSDILDNNQINFLMASIITLCGVLIES
jgi:uncharacterized membrane protein